MRISSSTTTRRSSTAGLRSTSRNCSSGSRLSYEKASGRSRDGSYLQPDVNNSSGESHIRQFLLGREYFEQTFGRYPRTAYNFDPFGHGEGYPQILAGCGMERYVFCRPDYGTYELPVGPFTLARSLRARGCHPSQ